MSNLLNDFEGRNVVIEAQKHLLRRRLSRFFKTNLVYDFNQSISGSSEFDLAKTLGQLNVLHDDELRNYYRLLGTIGGLEESIAEMDIYVDPTNGSDAAGTGSSDRPYASLWFMPHLPRRINHIYRIMLLGDLDWSYYELNIDMDFGDQGSLSIIGVGAAVPKLVGTEGNIVVATPTLNAVEQLNLSTVPSANSTLYFLQITSGALAGQAAPVGRVEPASSDVWCRFGPMGTVAGGESYRFIEPARNLTLASLNVKARGSNHPRNSLVNLGRVNFANLNIILPDDSGTGERQNICVIDSQVEATFSFCTLRGVSRTSEGQQWIKIYSDVNYSRPFDATGITSLTNSGVLNMINGTTTTKNGAGALIRLIDDTPLVNWQVLYSVSGNANISCWDCIGLNYLWSFNGRADGCWLGRVDMQRSNCKLKACAMSDPNGSLELITMFGSDAYLQWCAFGRGSSALWLVSSRAIVSNVGGDAAGTFTMISTGASMLGGSNLYFSTGAWVGTAPGISDLEFYDPSPTVTSAFPGAHAFIEDTFGSFAQRRN